jgi:signal transduction histidine kinase
MRYILASIFFGILLTFFGWFAARNLVTQVANQKFETITIEVENLVENRIREYFSVLNFTEGMFFSQNEITSDEFSVYFDLIQLKDRYPGFSAINFTRNATDSGTTERFIIDFIYPNEVNQSVIGLDLATDEFRGPAIRTARDSGQAIATQPLSLINTDNEGFIVVLPLYFKNLPTATVAQRRAAFAGVLTGVFQSDIFFDGVLPADSSLEFVSIRVLDQEAPPGNQLLFEKLSESPDSELRKQIEVPLAGRKWALEITGATNLFVDPFTAQLPNLVLVIGTIMTVLFAIMIYSLASSQARAVKIADQITAELQAKTLKLEEANEKLKDLDKMKSEFVSIASHELRTPLTAIKWLISMINDGDYGEITPQLREPLNDVTASTERLIDLVNDMLNLSRIEARRLKFDLTELESKSLIHEVVTQLLPIAVQKNITLDDADTASAIIQVDADKTKQVLNNLIGNSLKFTDQGKITVSAAIKDELLEILVTDTGMGISPDDQGKLFGKFQQITSQQAGKPIGSGLGLYISKQIAQKMGGDCWLKESTFGKGSTFAFSIPLAATPTAKKVKEFIAQEAVANPDQKPMS